MSWRGSECVNERTSDRAKRGKNNFSAKQNRNSIIVLDFSLFGIVLAFPFISLFSSSFLRQNAPYISTKSSLNSIGSGVHHHSLILNLHAFHGVWWQWRWNLESAQTIKVEYFIFGWISILLWVKSGVRRGRCALILECVGRISSVHKYCGVSSFCGKTARKPKFKFYSALMTYKAAITIFKDPSTGNFAR